MIRRISSPTPLLPDVTELLRHAIAGLFQPAPALESWLDRMERPL